MNGISWARAAGVLLTFGLTHLAAALAAPDQTVLQNRRLSITFSTADGSVLAITNRRIRTPCIAQGTQPCFPFFVQLKEPGFGRLLESLGAKNAGLQFEHKLGDVEGGQQLDLTYAYTKQKITVLVKVHLAADADTTTWKIAIDNRSRREVCQVNFPRIAGIRIGGKSDDDFLVMPAGMRGGHRFADPAKARHQAQYIGHGNMQWMDIYEDPAKGGKCGVYMGAHDKQLIGCRPSSTGDGAHGATMTIVKYVGVPPKTRWRSDPFVVGVHEGDWHRGADIYSAWAHSWMKMPRHPRWLTMCDGWDDFGRDLGKHFARWHSERKYGLRFRYPGNEKEFTEKLAKERASGRRISHYFNGQCFRVDHATKGLRNMYPELPAALRIVPWSELGKAAVRTPDGGYTGQYCTGPRDKWTVLTPKGIPCHDYIMCPASRQWRDWLTYWIVEKYVKEYKADVIYFDQTAAAGIKNCYDPSHGHVHPGVWAFGSAGMVEQIVMKARKINPDFVMAIEGSSDCLGQFADIHVISKSSVMKDPTIYPEIFSYTFPEYIIFDGYNNGRADEKGSVVFDKIFIRGHRFDLISRGAYDKAGVALRRAVKGWQYRAKFRDTVGLTASDESVQAKLFVRDDKSSRGAVVNIWNPTGAERATVTVSTREFGEVKRVYTAALGRELAPLENYRQAADRVTLPVPRERLSSYVLINRGKP